jgi:hypothetical protein
LVAGGEQCELWLGPLRAGSFEVTARRAGRMVGPIEVAIEPGRARVLEITVPGD